MFDVITVGECEKLPVTRHQTPGLSSQCSTTELQLADSHYPQQYSIYTGTTWHHQAVCDVRGSFIRKKLSVQLSHHDRNFSQLGVVSWGWDVTLSIIPQLFYGFLTFLEAAVKRISDFPG